ncbi:hypothetical protein LguiA_011931 [Lonicera macranthoides]
MASDIPQPITTCHVVAIPYPGRGHINPMMNLCKLIAIKRADFKITFIVTEEWFGFLGSEPKPANLTFATIPNVIPSELERAADFPGFYKATLTNLEEPVQRLLDRLELKPSVMIHDTYLRWVVEVGNRMNVPVASLWTMSAMVFTVSFFYDLLVQNGHVPVDLSDIKRREELISCIPGVPPTRIPDLLPTPFYGKGGEVLLESLDSISLVPKAQYLLLTFIYELESQVIDALKQHLNIPIYSIGPAIPYFKINNNSTHNENHVNYLKWLNAQPEASVMYISQGSFLSVSSAQLDEIVAGVHESGVRFFWVARGDNSRFKGGVGDKGLVVPWCDQLKVLCHPSVGAFWSHCGWNSTKEGLYAGVPMLTFPIFWDQIPNSKRIVEDWKIGWRVKRYDGDEILIKRDEIARLLKRFMDMESKEGKEMRKRAKEFKEICRQATSKAGSADLEIDAFIEKISQGAVLNTIS